MQWRKSHYATLGVKQDATTEEIKSAFRKLSLETHPDVAGPGANEERFKQISEAASVLVHSQKRQVYDARLREASPFGRGLHRQGATAAPWPRHGAAAPTEGLPLFFHTLMRPRTFVLGTMAVIAIGYVTTSSDKRNLQDGKDLVQAWKNPKTGRYEQPAPWDPTYQQLKPTLELVPRDEVRRRHR